MLRLYQRLALLVPLLLVLIPFLLWPSLFGFLASVTNYAPLETNVHWIGSANYAAILADREFGVSFLNIAIYILIAVPLELALGFGIAYLLREPFHGRRLARVLLLTPWLVSPISNGVMWRFLLSGRTGLPSYFLAWFHTPLEASPLGLHGLALPTVMLTDVWRLTPLVSFLLLPGLLSIPSEMWEQAVLEGASTFDRIRHIALPWLRPLFLTVGMLLVGATLGAFENVLVMTGGGPASDTFTPGLYSYTKAFDLKIWPLGSTAAWIIAAALFLIGLVYLTLMRKETE